MTTASGIHGKLLRVTSSDARWVEEALVVYRRYATEVVEGLKLCPWALPARKAGRVREKVLLLESPDVHAAAAAAAAVARDESIDIGLLIFPKLELSRQDFERFVARIREVDTAFHAPASAPMAMAAFHPDAEPNLESAERLTPFLRCTPDPTIQLVRTTALDSVRSNDEHGSALVDLSTIDLATFLATPPKAPMHERIAETNLATVRAKGVDEVRALLRDIRDERNRRYEALRASKL